jgi:hypothetical protein
VTAAFNGQDKLQLFSCLPKRQERERFFHGCNVFVTAAVNMLDLSPIWQTPAIGARCSDFERSEIAGLLVRFRSDSRIIANANLQYDGDTSR